MKEPKTRRSTGATTSRESNDAVAFSTVLSS
jgi:hypothetical protein